MTITTLSIISAETKREQTEIAIAIKEEKKKKNKEKALKELFDRVKLKIDQTTESYCCSYTVFTNFIQALQIDIKEVHELMNIISILLTNAGYHVQYSEYCASTTRKNGKIGILFIDWK